MGRLEKIVVLTVLFLVAVVLGVALTPSGNTGSGKDDGGPLQGAADAGQAIQTPGPAAKPLGILNAEADLTAKSPANETLAMPQGPAAPSDAGSPPLIVNGAIPANGAKDAVPTPPVAQPAPAIAKFILTTEGLEPSGMADTMFYAWKQGDTFAALAQRYYGSKDKVGRLTKANEGRAEASLKVDERLWIPIAESPRGEAAAEGKFYVVKAGDVLGAISQEFYGTSKKWQKILDANRDTLSSPEKLKPGMKLRIPE